MITPNFVRRAGPKAKGLDALLRHRLLLARGEGDLRDLAIGQLLPPDDLLGVEEGARAIADAIARGVRIHVIADRDADGATACAVAVRGLKAFGAKVLYSVPNPLTEGYGLSPSLVERILPLRPGLILTVDNGISSLAGVEAANRAGVPVVITDHHLPGAQLPKAEVIINPNQPGCSFKSKCLAGVGVVFYLLVALKRLFRSREDARSHVPVAPLLDLVALGTIADMVPLDRNNRILVAAGLHRIRAGRASPGVAALFSVAGRPVKKASAFDLSFFIAPRVNSAGRLEDGTEGIACLITEVEEGAQRLAEDLNRINFQRREIQSAMQGQAEQLVQKFAGTQHTSIVLYDAEWHPGCTSAVASYLKEKLSRPVVIVAPAGDGFLKGSARSVPGLHIRDAFAEIDRQMPGAIIRFGGHAMAAGLTLEEGRLEEFTERLGALSQARLAPSLPESAIEHDGPLSRHDLTVQNALWIESEPWGEGFPAPSFLVEAPVKGFSLLKGKHSKFVLELDGVKIEALLFNQVIPDYSTVRVHGRLCVNEWNGRKTLQMIATHILPGDGSRAGALETTVLAAS